MAGTRTRAEGQDKQNLIILSDNVHIVRIRTYIVAAVSLGGEGVLPVRNHLIITAWLCQTVQPEDYQRSHFSSILPRKARPDR